MIYSVINVINDFNDMFSTRFIYQATIEQLL